MSGHTYHTDDLIFGVPAGFTDRTVHALEWESKGDRLALALQREALRPHQSLEQIYQVAVGGYPKQLLGFRVDEEKILDLGGLDARAVRFRWKHDKGVMYHHQVFFVLDGKSFVFTATGPAKASADVDKLIEQALAELRLRES